MRSSSKHCSTEPGVNECLLNVSHFYSKFLRHHFIGIASLSFEEGIIVMAILQMGTLKFREEKRCIERIQ